MSEFLLSVTGDMKDVANAAWVSTQDISRRSEKSHTEVRRVVKYLIENYHTSPLESVTLTFHNLCNISLESVCRVYSTNKYAVGNEDKLTLDLLNFAKITAEYDCWLHEPWQEFKKQRPELAELLENFKSISDSRPDYNAQDKLNLPEIEVELISLHKNEELEHSRATWRIKCPLSIATQVLRHRKGSFNETSGRYRTIKQDLVSVPEDCKIISNKINLNLESLFNQSRSIIDLYLDAMKTAKDAESNKYITNAEYKRLREVIRFVLPEGRMTELYVTFYLSDFYQNYLPLRESVHAQTEHVLVAQLMKKALEEYEPET